MIRTHTIKANVLCVAKFNRIGLMCSQLMNK